ncbi:GNAT family N-acetyltransferase [Terricaulis sp.]|uniref:GNAT family N-acetyltransferase n=1 Tax=Terricaulis sp. TaxID=2768686 RepID=UPI0037839234
MIETARLRLIPATRDCLEAELVRDHAKLGALLGARVDEGCPPDLYDAGAMQWTLDAYNREPAFRDWGMLYFVSKEAPALIGVGGYKGPPRDGVIELGYSVVPPRQRQGFATEATLGMTAHAFANPEIARVIAHTLAELVASIGVLEKAGFRLQPDTLEEGAIMFAIDRADWGPSPC